MVVLAEEENLVNDEGMFIPSRHGHASHFRPWCILQTTRQWMTITSEYPYANNTWASLELVSQLQVLPNVSITACSAQSASFV